MHEIVFALCIYTMCILMSVGIETTLCFRCVQYTVHVCAYSSCLGVSVCGCAYSCLGVTVGVCGCICECVSVLIRNA